MENDASKRWKAAVSSAVTRLEKGMHFTTESREHLVECYKHGVLEYVAKGFIKTLFKFVPQYLLIAETDEITKLIMSILMNISFCYQLCLSDEDFTRFGLYVFSNVAEASNIVRESDAFDYSPDL